MRKKKRVKRQVRKVPKLSPAEIDALPECETGNQHGALVRCSQCGCATVMKVVRGICTNHYGYLNRLVLSGRTTWESLESLGIVLPVGQRGAPRKNDAFMNRVESLLSESVVNVPGNPLAGIELSQLGS